MVNEPKAKSFEKILEQSGLLVYKTKGVSMLPLLHENRDLITIQKKELYNRCKKKDVVLFKRDNGQYVLHRILRVRENDYWIVGDNCISGEYVRDDQILGVLIMIKRNGRTITVNNKLYLLYVHAWCDLYPVRFWLIRLSGLLRRIIIKTILGRG